VNHLEGTKTVVKIANVAADGGAFSHEIDTYGADYVSVDLCYSTFTATSAAYATVLKVQESDTAGSGQTDVPGGTVTAVAGTTTGNHVARFNVDMRGRKRYITVVGNPGKPATVASVARLSKLEDEPYNAATANVSNYVSVAGSVSYVG
jgi:hypothetical protein